jgi:hypothetical protein
MSDIFDAPEAQHFDNQNETVYPLYVEYKAGKTPAAYVSYNTPEQLEQHRLQGKVGFSYYDHEKQSTFVVNAPLTFAVLESYAAITGYDGNYNYNSNRVKDSRSEPFRVYMRGAKSPSFVGLYQQIKDSLPEGVGFHIHLVCYCIELERTIEIKLTKLLQAGIERAMSESAAKVGRRLQKVNFFSIADNDVINGFQWNGKFIPLDKDGNDLSANKDAYYTPAMHHGVISPTGKNVELHAVCVQWQKQVRDQHERLKRSAQQPAPETQQPTAPAQQPPSNARQVADPGAPFDANDLPF